jgi:HK97 gp10 family phage protein
MPKITGMKAHSARLGRIAGPEMVRQVGAALYAAGSLIETEAAQLITAGAVSGKNHVASAPGDAPNADTHQLDRSIETVQVEPLKVEVSANAPHAVLLEFGTSRMAERPFMRPATARKRKEAVDLIAGAVKKVIAGGKVVA